MVEDSNAAASVVELHLLGAPTLVDFVDRVKERSVDGRHADLGGLIAQWREGEARYRQLASDEAGLAESASLQALPAALARLTHKVVDDRYFKQAFASLPVGFGWVELDTLVVLQHHVSLSHAADLSAALGPSPSEDAVFRFCLPDSHRPPEVRVAQSGTNRFVFSSPLSDLRSHGPQFLGAGLVGQVASDGPLAEGVGVFVGYGSAYLNVVRHADRLVLNNGYHRAYALRSIGLTHAPCVVQAVAHPEELAFAGDDALVEHYHGLFVEPRPPMLKDFFDPALTTRLTMPRSRKQLQVTIDVEIVRVPE